MVITSEYGSRWILAEGKHFLGGEKPRSYGVCSSLSFWGFLSTGNDSHLGDDKKGKKNTQLEFGNNG